MSFRIEFWRRGQKLSKMVQNSFFFTVENHNKFSSQNILTSSHINVRNYRTKRTSGTSWIKPNICRFNRWRWQHVSEKFRLLFSKANSNYCNAKNREIWPQGLDLGTASNWRTSAQIKTLRPYFLTLIYQSISFFFVSGYFSAQQTAFVCRKFQK